MKNSFKYLMLWQKKRSELPVDDDPQADWDQMRSLLDQHMSVIDPGAGGKPSRFKGFKLLPTLFIAFSAAAMVYTVSTVYKSEKNKHRIEHKLHKGNPIASGSLVSGSSNKTGSTTYKDSLTGSIISDSLTAANSKTAKDNLLPQKESLPAQNGAETKSAASKTPANGSSLSVSPNKNASQSANKNNLLASNGQNKNNAALISHNSNKSASSLFTGNKTSNSKGFPSRHGNKNTPAKSRGSRGVTSRYLSGTAGQKAAVAANEQSLINAPDVNNARQNLPDLLTTTPPPGFNMFATKTILQPTALPGLNNNIFNGASSGKSATAKNKKEKPPKMQNSKPSNVDWGLLTGINSSGSFTPKNQNNNFYGSAPVDVYFGLFASFKLNDNWAINPQVRLFSPQTINTTYSHANQSKVDSGQSLTITASRKLYAVNVPIFAVYKVGNGISFKAGPVINFPVKQTNTSSTLLPYSIRSDTAYYKKISAILNGTQYEQKLNFGFSGGASMQVKRWIFEATYLKSLSGYGISSGLGSYKSYNGTIQFTIGFQLDKVKP